MKNIIKKQLLHALMILSMGGSCAAQVKSLSIAAVDSAMLETSKPLLILISTDWCKYCQMQKNQLLKNKDFQSSANLFYYVEFNAESIGDIPFNGKMYHYKSTGVSTGLHELAITLNGPGAVAFPTWVLLDKNYQPLFKYNGVLSPAQLKEVVKAMNKI